MALSIDFLASGSVSATYSQSGTSVTVTKTAHGLLAGHKIYLDFTSGTGTDAWGQIASITSADVFVVTVSASATTSGNVTYHHNLGGAASAISVPSSEALFTPAPLATVGKSGITGLRNYNKTPIYRCVYVKNTYGSARTYTDLSVYVTQQNSSYMSIDIAPSASTVDVASSAYVPETTAPAITGTWGASANMGSIPNGSSRALWIRLIGKDTGGGSNGGWSLGVSAKY